LPKKRSPACCWPVGSSSSAQVPSPKQRRPHFAVRRFARGRPSGPGIFHGWPPGFLRGNRLPDNIGPCFDHIRRWHRTGVVVNKRSTPGRRGGRLTTGNDHRRPAGRLFPGSALQETKWRPGRAGRPDFASRKPPGVLGGPAVLGAATGILRFSTKVAGALYAERVERISHSLRYAGPPGAFDFRAGPAGPEVVGFRGAAP